MLPIIEFCIELSEILRSFDFIRDISETLHTLFDLITTPSYAIHDEIFANKFFSILFF